MGNQCREDRARLGACIDESLPDRFESHLVCDNRRGLRFRNEFHRATPLALDQHPFDTALIGFGDIFFEPVFTQHMTRHLNHDVIRLRARVTFIA